jgi:hypothetical protein
VEVSNLLKKTNFCNIISFIIMHIDSLLSGDSANNDRFWATAPYTRSRGNEYARSNRVTFGNAVFLRIPCRDVTIISSC